MTDPPTDPMFVSGAVSRQLFNWKEAIQAIQESYAQAIPRAASPPRSVGADERAWLRTLPALPPGGRYFGAKLMGMSLSASSPGVEYVIVLFDRATSRIAAFVDANMITAYRTAATSAAALDRLTPQQPLRLAVLGSGLEASMHTRAFASIRQLAEIIVFSPTPDRRDAFAAAASEDLAIPARAAASAAEAVAGADLVLAAARAHGELPILHGEWLAPECAIVSIGSTVPEQREIDASVVEASDLIVCDVLHEVLSETGDMIAARKAGVAFEDKVFALTDLMTGKLDERVQSAKRPMFKSVGSGLQDVVVAELILTKAIAAGLATPLPIQFETKR